MSVSTLRTTADPTPIAEAAQPFAVGNTTILVETPHQLLVNKLCALLSRSELRDLIDVRVLIESGIDLPRTSAPTTRNPIRSDRCEIRTGIGQSSLSPL